MVPSTPWLVMAVSKAAAAAIMEDDAEPA